MFIDKFLGFFVVRSTPFLATICGLLVFMYSGTFLFKTIPMYVFSEYINFINAYSLTVMGFYLFGNKRIHKKMQAFSKLSEERLVEVKDKERARRNKTVERQGAVAREDDEEYKRLDEEVRKMDREMQSFIEGLNNNAFDIIKILAFYDRKNSKKMEEMITKIKNYMEENKQQ